VSEALEHGGQAHANQRVVLDDQDVPTPLVVFVLVIV
jgi:hypothetical protein